MWVPVFWAHPMWAGEFWHPAAAAAAPTEEWIAFFTEDE